MVTAIEASEHKEETSSLGQETVVHKNGVSVESISFEVKLVGSKCPLVQILILYLFNIYQFIPADFTELQFEGFDISGDCFFNVFEEVGVFNLIALHLVKSYLLILPEFYQF